ncbi:hypothetical protein UFOVP1290_284 [uncultured Caudovirales phage]|uniref:Uncharacterized protein n=1 Tax=uncultured Caudovirales phage TaxID=2100421 RepID=A0A6J5RXL7_9CAUD|nr:hypothetical protein UFOVP1290_284 [uncultured Caudovirales phage]
MSHGLRAEIKYMNNEDNFLPPDFFEKKVEQTRQELYLYIEEPSDIEVDIVSVKEEKYSIVIDLFGNEDE